MSEEELKEYYATGYQEMRRGRFWFFGSRTPWWGSKVDYFLPNEYLMALSDWRYSSTMYPEDTYWKYNWLPSPRFPFAPLQRLFDPYWFERCVAEGTPIICADGTVKDVEDISVGDIVINFLGEECAVEGVWSEQIDEEVVGVTPSLFTSFPIVTTPEHRYLAIKTKRCPKRNNRPGAICTPDKTASRCKNCEY
ncbi:MAG: hypothetical protein H5U03_09345, partial [Clostridia bacterium]|nr:hypothetical protein [Clostridia bacterium]